MFSPLLIIIGATLFFFGAAIGSFLNLVIYRTQTGEQWVKGRSKCESCKHQLSWFENVPIFSFILLRGKCRHCSAPLSISHVVVESLMGTLFLWWYAVGFIFFQLSQQPFTVLQPIFWLIVGVLLLTIIIYDYKYMLIPDGATIALLAMALLYRISLVLAGIMRPEDFFWTIAGMVLSVAFFYSLWYFTKGKGFGFGDVKLMAPLALLMGWPSVWVGIFLSTIVGSVIGLAMIFLGKAAFGKPIPFGPFLILGTVLSLIWGDALVAWYVTLI